MAKIRRKDFIGGKASEFEIISNNTGMYIFAALILLGVVAALI
jgi:hypothetical protein